MSTREQHRISIKELQDNFTQAEENQAAWHDNYAKEQKTEARKWLLRVALPGAVVVPAATGPTFIFPETFADTYAGMYTLSGIALLVTGLTVRYARGRFTASSNHSEKAKGIRDGTAFW